MWYPAATEYGGSWTRCIAWPDAHPSIHRADLAVLAVGRLHCAAARSTTSIPCIPYQNNPGAAVSTAIGSRISTPTTAPLESSASPIAKASGQVRDEPLIRGIPAGLASARIRAAFWLEVAKRLSMKPGLPRGTTFSNKSRGMRPSISVLKTSLLFSTTVWGSPERPPRIP